MSSSSFLLTMNYLLLYPPATMRKPKPPSRDLQTLILNELKQNRREMHRLSKLSGIPYRWPRAVAGGHIRSPNFSRLVRVATFVGIRVICRTTTIPLEIIEIGIRALMEPDPKSRSSAEEGRRIILRAPPRDWGWRIVNFAAYHKI